MLDRRTSSIAPGTPVVLEDAKRVPVGVVALNPASGIAARDLDRDPEATVDESMIQLGELPSPIAPPSGCRFRTRCPLADEQCARDEPQMRRVNDDHYVACHHPLVDVEEMEVSIS